MPCSTWLLNFSAVKPTVWCVSIWRRGRKGNPRSLFPLVPSVYVQAGMAVFLPTVCSAIAVASGRERLRAGRQKSWAPGSAPCHLWALEHPESPWLRSPAPQQGTGFSFLPSPLCNSRAFLRVRAMEIQIAFPWHVQVLLRYRKRKTITREKSTVD